MNASALTVARSLKASDVLAALERAIEERGIPGHIRSDNGPEFIAGITRQYLSENGIKTLYIEPGSPCKMVMWKASITACVMSA